MEVPGRGEDREVPDLQGLCVSDDRLAGMQAVIESRWL
jgi:hypothetical protein